MATFARIQNDTGTATMTTWSGGGGGGSGGNSIVPIFIGGSGSGGDSDDSLDRGSGDLTTCGPFRGGYLEDAGANGLAIIEW